MNKKEIIVEKKRKIVPILQDFGFSYADIQKMLRNKDVKIDGIVAKKDDIANPGSSVVVYYKDADLQKKYDVIYENENFCVIFKRAGINSDGENGLEGVIPHAIAVHRLDRNTEGLMIFAKNEETAIILENAFKQKLVHKIYLAEVVGKCDKNGIFKAFLLKNAEKSTVKIFNHKVLGSVEIETGVKTVSVGEKSSFVEVELLTGKTHQIRAHLAYMGFPIVGDDKYGESAVNKSFGAKFQHLTCVKLSFDDVGISDLLNKVFECQPTWIKNN